MSNSQCDVTRIAKLLGMLGSAYDHEALTAGRTADRLRRESGVSWQQLIIQSLPPPEPPRPSTPDLAEMIDTLRRCWLTEWEREFVRTVGQRLKWRSLTDKEAQCLLRIWGERVGGAA